MPEEHERKEAWFWPTVLGICFGGLVGFYCFWTGGLLRSQTEHWVQILTAFATLGGAAAAVIAAYISRSSAQQSLEVSRESSVVAERSARAAEQSAIAARESAESIQTSAAAQSQLVELGQFALRQNLVPDFSISQIYGAFVDVPHFRVELRGPVDAFAVEMTWNATVYSDVVEWLEEVSLSRGSLSEPRAMLPGEQFEVSLKDCLKNAIENLHDPDRAGIRNPDRFRLQVRVSVKLHPWHQAFWKVHDFVVFWTKNGWVSFLVTPGDGAKYLRPDEEHPPSSTTNGGVMELKRVGPFLKDCPPPREE